jgi:hypothetical protein
MHVLSGSDGDTGLQLAGAVGAGTGGVGREAPWRGRNRTVCRSSNWSSKPLPRSSKGWSRHKQVSWTS